MTAKKEKTEEVIDRLDRFMSELAPADALIMSMGFYAGYNGYTPLTAIINQTGSGGYYQNLIDRANRGDVAAGFQGGLMFGGGLLGASLGAMYSAFKGPIDALTGNPAVGEAERQDIIKGFQAKIAMACMGAIEAYAITRPGTIQGIGEIVKGIGDIIPG